MLNTYVKAKTYNTIKINAVSGGIYKTYHESWFQRFHLQSKMAETLLKPYDRKIKVDTSYYSSEEVSVIQMVLCGDMEVMAEVIRTVDLEKYLLKGDEQ